MSHPQPGSRPPQPQAQATRATLARVYAHHFAEVQRLEARRLAAANRRIRSGM